MREFLGPDYPEFEQYMMMRAARSGPDGRVFFDVDVQMYLTLRERAQVRRESAGGPDNARAPEIASSDDHDRPGRDRASTSR